MTEDEDKTLDQIQEERNDKLRQLLLERPELRQLRKGDELTVCFKVTYNMVCMHDDGRVREDRILVDSTDPTIPTALVSLFDVVSVARAAPVLAVRAKVRVRFNRPDYAGYSLSVYAVAAIDAETGNVWLPEAPQGMQTVHRDDLLVVESAPLTP